jgi:hypothetical protein
MTTKITCEEFERILEQQDDAGLPRPALAHIEDCEACRFLAADLTAIRDAAMELGAEELPVPERVWISLRNQIDAESLEGAQLPAATGLKAGWWSALQRPALAGAFLSLILSAAALVGYQSGSVPMAVHSPLAPLSESAPILSAEKEFKEESLAFGNASLAELRVQDAAVTDSFRRNLSLVDHFIAMCENSVREQPDNEMAREYLYGAYEQKAELLATAMNRNVTGGLQ